jgi:hypothetical protein
MDDGRHLGMMSRREISRGECLDLLAHAKVGRIVFVRGAVPEVIPVCYTVAGESVAFGVHSSSPVANELEGTVVAFQADSFDSERECGWHVRAIGTFGPAVAPAELAAAGAVVPEPWIIGEPLERILQIDLEVVNGYAIEDTAEASWPNAEVPLREIVAVTIGSKSNTSS